MRSRVGARRRWAKGAGVITFVATALLAGLSTTGQASAQSDPEGLLPPGDWTQEQEDFLLNMIDEAEATLPATFPTGVSEAEVKSVLEPLGFVDIGAVAPGGYWHFVNRDWVFDEHTFNPEFAESLVYQGERGGDLELVAAMYILPVASIDDVPEEYKWIPGWHTHPELCFDENGQLAGIIAPGDTCPPGTAPSERGPMIHVWIVDNECGHRFGGVGVGGLHCDEHDDGHDDGHDDEHDDGNDEPGVGDPAPAVAGSPGFTG